MIPFYGGVPPAVQNESLVTSEEAAGVRPQSQVFSPLGGVSTYELTGVCIGPTIFHANPRMILK
jgi:hypothetical protein